jgi:multiple sugar transport system substrate-binding protein
MQGLNRQAILVEKGIAKSLEPFIAKEADFRKGRLSPGHARSRHLRGRGLRPAVLDLAARRLLQHGSDGQSRHHRSDRPAEDLGRSHRICGKLREAGVKNPMFWGWNITGNWFLQALMWSPGQGHRRRQCDFQIDSPEGLKALETMKGIFRGCDMQNLEWKAALASFSAGEIGMMFWSTSAVGAVERAKGDFT